MDGLADFPKGNKVGNSVPYKAQTGKNAEELLTEVAEYKRYAEKNHYAVEDKGQKAHTDKGHRAHGRNQLEDAKRGEDYAKNLDQDCREPRFR